MTVFRQKKDKIRYYYHPLPPPITHDSVGAGIRGGAQKSLDCRIRVFGKRNFSIGIDKRKYLLIES